MPETSFLLPQMSFYSSFQSVFGTADIDVVASRKSEHPLLANFDAPGLGQMDEKLICSLLHPKSVVALNPRVRQSDDPSPD